MKVRIGQLLLWHTIFYIIYYVIRDVAFVDGLEYFNNLADFEILYVEGTGYLAFLAYSAGTYIIMLNYYSKNWSQITFFLFLNIIFATFIRYLLQEMIAPHFFGFRNYRASISLFYYFIDNLYYSVLHTAIGFIFFFVQYSKFKEKKQQELIVQNQKTELAYLRAQINPHFLFNTLNNIYSLVYQKSDKALQSVEKLTAMLRYGLYEHAEKVPLEREVQSLYNFIELEKMRYDYPLNLKIDITKNINKIEVPPFLLIPFVENAFKHGDLKQPLYILLQQRENELLFQVKNTIKSKQKDQIGGIGLVNIKKRLELIYGSQQNLHTNQEGEIFEIKLVISMRSLKHIR